MRSYSGPKRRAAVTVDFAITLPIFFLLVFFGIFRAFVNQATQSLVPNLVPKNELSSAIALATSSWQVATIIGPAFGGLLYGIGAEMAGKMVQRTTLSLCYIGQKVL